MNHNALLLRRIIAIVLMACTVVLRFWPSFFGTKIKTDYFSENSELSFYEIRDSFTESLDEAIEELEDLEYYEEPFVKAYMIASVVMGFFINVAFFGLIALAGMAIVLMIFNRSKAATVLHTILSFLTVALFIAHIVMWIILMKEESAGWSDTLDITAYPGVAMILLPLFSLVASILYKRDTSYKGAFPPRAVPQPAYATIPPVARSPYAPQPPVRPAAPAEWICPSCNAKNDPADPFCPYCGTKNPAPVVKQAETIFCTNCGARQRPDATFCPNCGSKLN